MKIFDLNKSVKILIIINGVLLPVFILYSLYKMLGEYSSYDNYGGDDIIVGEELDEAARDSLALQGLHYDNLAKVYNSTNYFLFVAAKTYEEAREFKKMMSMVGDISVQEDNWLNVAFFDKDLNVIGNLLSQKATISRYILKSPYSYGNKDELDTTVRNIAWFIGFNDTNGDGRLSSSDYHDWYISDLDGKNLKKKVTDGLDVIDLEFIDFNKKILVTYVDRSNIRDEYKRNKFAVYDIASSVLTKLPAIDDQLNKIEKMLIQ